MTAAHPTLPIPSYVRVTRAGTDRSVVVRVNDRGPFLQNRLIDLSYTAAAKLGFVEMGSAEVEVEAITQFDGPGAPMLVEAGGAATSAGPAASAGTATPATSAAVVATSAAATPAGNSVPSAEDRPVALTVATSREDALPDSSAREGVPGRLAVETRFSDAGRDLDRAAQSTAVASSPAGLSAERVPAEHTSMPLSPTQQAGAQTGAQAAAQTGAQAAAETGAPGFWLQLGAFASANGARTALERFRRELAWLGTRFDLRHEGGLYKVQAGPWVQRDHALEAAARVRGVTGLQSFPIFR